MTPQYTEKEIEGLISALKGLEDTDPFVCLILEDLEDLSQIKTNEELLTWSRRIKWARAPMTNKTSMYILIYGISYDDILLSIGSDDTLTQIVTKWRLNIGR